LRRNVRLDNAKENLNRNFAEHREPLVVGSTFLLFSMIVALSTDLVIGGAFVAALVVWLFSKKGSWLYYALEIVLLALVVCLGILLVVNW
jgi:hypothetical protein